MACWLYVFKHFYSCANERQDDGQQHEPSRCLYNHRQPPTSNHTNDWRGNTSSLLSKARRNDRQTTDRQTNLLYVCMYVLTFSLCTSVVSLLLILFFFGVEGTSLPRHPTYQHPLHYFQTFGIRSFSDYQNVFKRFQITGLLSAWTFSDIWISTFLRSVKVYPFSPQAVGALRGLPKEVVCLFGGSPLGTKATTTHLQR